MANVPQPMPEWIIARLGDDLNWWMEESSRELPSETTARGLLDPRQVAHLTQALDAYRPYGFRPEQLAHSFQVYALETELSDGRVRLGLIDGNIYNTSEQLFALPLIQDEGEGEYCEFLEILATARIRFLNSTRHYARDCSAEEMYAELDALENDRFFNAANVHVFAEVSEILEWKPAEWDDGEL